MRDIKGAGRIARSGAKAKGSNHGSIWLCPTAIVVAGMVASLWGPVSTAQSRPVDDCQRFVFRDYAPPLLGSGAGGRLPRSAPLSGGPSSVRIDRSVDRVLAGGGRVGFVLQNSRFRPLRNVDLSVSLQLTRLPDARSMARGKVRRLSVRIRRFASYEQRTVGMRVGGRPATYRLLVQIENHESGQRVRYREYYRVVQRKIDARLGVFPRQIQVGGDVRFRLVNAGTVALDSGRAFFVERWTVTGWSSVPELTPGTFPQDRITLGAGIMGDCETLSLPPGTPEGSYRVVKVVRPVSRNSRTGIRKVAGKFVLGGS